MPYDEELAGRVRALLGPDRAQERRMFGGLAFLVGDALAVAVSGQGGLMVRVDPADEPALLARPHTGPVEMGQRGPVRGWVRVAEEGLADDDALAAWVRRGVERARAPG